jgi:ubiquinone/menaquinone biosynthesis C-methylase UbiE
MLPRILEPEVMDTPEEAHDYDTMDHSAVNRVFVADLLAVWDGRNPVLDVGTGTALIPVELCKTHPTATVVAIDLAEHMLAVARDNVARAGFAARIRLEKANGRALAYGDGSFSAVMSNSIVHHIPEPIQTIREMVRVCAVGGTIFVRDLMRPADRGTLNQLVEMYAGDANAHQKKMFSDSLHAALTLDEIRDLVGRCGFDPASVRATTDRHWTWSTKRFSPLVT